MTNKPMLSVERELLERAVSAVIVARGPGSPTERDLRAILDRAVECLCRRYGKDNPHWPCPIHSQPSAQHQGEPVNFLTPDCPDCACVQDGQCLCIPSKPADHPQCEECKGWGYHENHYEGGGTECGECGGSGKAPVEQFSADTVVCRRYQLEQHPGQNFYHYDLEPVYGSVPVTVSELITMVESAPVAVVMPEPYGLAMFKMLSGFDSVTPEQFNLVWTACRKEVARLNGVKP
ncbi:MAG: hypothetical protein J6D44_06150 [Pseudomonas sp.]|nr:hypothetical protein [Pseudomonas sp.]